MQEIIGILGGLVVLAAHIPLYIAILRKTATPSFATWSMWSVMAIILLSSQIMAGKQDPWGMLAVTVGTIGAAILLIVRGKKKWEMFDTFCLSLVAVAITIWVIAGPAVAQIASFSALVIAGIPTIKNVWKDPRNENRLTWGMFALGFGMTVIAVNDWSNLIIWFQPVGSTAFNLMIFALTLRRKPGTK